MYVNKVGLCSDDFVPLEGKSGSSLPDEMLQECITHLTTLSDIAACALTNNFIN